MTKQSALSLASIVVGALLTNPADAALIDRGGGLIYDSALNVTWLADANYAKTSGYDADGKMSWQNAAGWADSLSYYDSVRNVSYTDWRLPTFNDLGGVGCDYGYSGTDCGYNVSTVSSELAHLYYGDLANKGFVDSRGLQQDGYGLVDDPANPHDESLFSNIQTYYYWIGTPYNGTGGNSQDHAWYLQTATGMQNYTSKGSNFYAWAVRDGDVATVPAPESFGLFISGMGLIGLAVNRQRKAVQINTH